MTCEFALMFIAEVCAVLWSYVDRGRSKPVRPDKGKGDKDRALLITARPLPRHLLLITDITVPFLRPRIYIHRLCSSIRRAPCPD